MPKPARAADVDREREKNRKSVGTFGEGRLLRLPQSAAVPPKRAGGGPSRGEMLLRVPGCACGPPDDAWDCDIHDEEAQAKQQKHRDKARKKHQKRLAKQARQAEPREPLLPGLGRGWLHGHPAAKDLE